jgi:hypothetical protein
MTRISWPPVLDEARLIVASYDTGVTLRQLFYRLVAAALLPNLGSYYKRLSEYTARGRRDGGFPELLDRASRIEEPLSFTDPDHARGWLRDLYRRDRTLGQPWTIVLGVEKAGMSEQIDAWFSDPFGIPHVALGGYASQSLCDETRRYVESYDRPAVLLYAGDHDPSGEDIDRDFAKRVGVFNRVERVALNAEQLAEYAIPQNQLDPEVGEKLERDPRSTQFRERHGYLDQYELDALDPSDLHDLYAGALADFWDTSTFEATVALEDSEREELAPMATDDEELEP